MKAGSIEIIYFNQELAFLIFSQILAHLWRLGYSPEDIIGNIFRVCKTFQMAEYLKLEFIKVGLSVGAWLGSGNIGL